VLLRRYKGKVEQVKKEEPKVSGSSDNNRKRKSDSSTKNKQS
jgi:hypothetical protein